MNTDHSPRFFPLGDDALIVEFGRTISRELNKRAIALADSLDRSPFPGYIESVPAYASTAVYFDLRKVQLNSSAGGTAFESVRSYVELLLHKSSTLEAPPARVIEIPASFDQRSGPDISLVADFAGMTRDELIKVFTSRTYHVYMLGFLPGFAYMGEVDDRIAMGRCDTPRLRVPSGSIGIAGRQTGIYPLESPGGWRIIGRTRLRMFDVAAAEPSALRVGDTVRFVPE